MSDITPFRFPQDGRDIRVVRIDGEPWFVANDVAMALGYLNPSQALSSHVDPDDRDDLQILDSIGRRQATPVINESGLYALIFGSRLPTAKAFKRWVTSEVLPALRRTGSYAMAEEDDLDAAQRIITTLREDRRRIRAVEGRQDVMQSQLSGVLGHYDEFAALGYAKHAGLDTGRSYLSKLGRMATKIMRERGAEPHTRQDSMFGDVNVYPVDVLEEAVRRIV